MAADESPNTVSNEVESVRCECCGITEECTESYIRKVQDIFKGKWICGLCAEAVKNEESRIGNEEALNQHMCLCKNFRSLRQPSKPDVELIPAMKQLFLRSLDSPRSSSRRKDDVTIRSKSCFSEMDR